MLFPSRSPPIIRLLRDATRDVHLRMHGHPGFCAVLDGSITSGIYRRLLGRLYGFYADLKLCSDGEAARSAWLTDDLLFLGETSASLAAIPRCADLPALATVNQRLGARYVIEGSALGGRELARGLDQLLGVGLPSGRRFFQGHGARTGEVWRQSLALLASAPDDPQTQSEIVDAAVATFSAFERWSAGWSEHIDG